MARKPRKPVDETPPESLDKRPRVHDLTMLAGQVAANPLDETLRLVYADCLDENGKPVEAATIRAEITIRQTVRAKMAALDAAYLEKRVAFHDALREMATQGVPADDPSFAVCRLVAQSIILGRQDGYPEIGLPQSAQLLVSAALAAGMLPMFEAQQVHFNSVGIGSLRFLCDGSGVCVNPSGWDDVYDAFAAANHYRHANRSNL